MADALDLITTSPAPGRAAETANVVTATVYADAVDGEPLQVIVPSFDDRYRFEVDSHAAGLVAGDVILIAFDEEGEPWQVASPEGGSGTITGNPLVLDGVELWGEPGDGGLETKIGGIRRGFWYTDPSGSGLAIYAHDDGVGGYGYSEVSYMDAAGDAHWGIGHEQPTNNLYVWDSLVAEYVLSVDSGGPFNFYRRLITDHDFMALDVGVSAAVMDKSGFFGTYAAVLANWAYAAQVDGDANPRWLVLASGEMRFGDGTAYPDANLYRYGAGQLAIDGLIWSRGVHNAVAGGALIGGDAWPRFWYRTHGLIEWGNGTAAPDTSLQRTGVGELSTGGNFIAQGDAVGYGRLIVSNNVYVRGAIVFHDGASFDVNLYRGGADALATDDAFWASGDVVGNMGTNQVALFDGNGRAEVLFGSAGDTSLYRQSPNVLATDDAFVAGGVLYANGGLAVDENGSNMTLVGTDHVYQGWYPDGFGAGRKAYTGFGSPANDYFYIASESGGDGSVVISPSGTGTVQIGGALTLATDLDVAQGGTGGSTAAAARTNLGVPTITRGTSFPGSPADGDIHFYPADGITSTPSGAGTGVVWQFIYESSDGDWYYVGGHPAVIYDGDVREHAGPDKTVYGNLATDPMSLTLPALAGDWDIEVTAAMQQPGGFEGNYLSYAVGATAASQNWSTAAGFLNSGTIPRLYRHTGVAASAVIAEKVRLSNASNAGSFHNRQIKVWPHKLTP